MCLSVSWQHFSTFVVMQLAAHTYFR